MRATRSILRAHAGGPGAGRGRSHRPWRHRLRRRAMAHMNHLEPNLATALGFIGITRIHQIAIEGQEVGASCWPIRWPRRCVRWMRWWRSCRAPSPRHAPASARARPKRASEPVWRPGDASEAAFGCRDRAEPSAPRGDMEPTSSPCLPLGLQCRLCRTARSPMFTLAHLKPRRRKR